MTERRARVSMEGSGIRIVVPASFRRSGFVPVALFAAVWLWFWGDSIASELDAANGAMSDVVVSAVLILVGACFFLPTLLWAPFGRDNVLVTPDAVVLRRRFGPFGWSRRFAASEIEAIEADEIEPPSRFYFLFEFGLAGPGRGGAVDIRIGPKTHSFGEVGLAEAEDLVRRICTQLGRPVGEREPPGQ